MVDRNERQIEPGETADLAGPQTTGVDDPRRLDALPVDRVDRPAAGRRLSQRRHGRVLPDDGAVQARTCRERLRQRVRVDVPVTGRVQTGLDVIHVQQRVKSTDFVRPDEPL